MKTCSKCGIEKEETEFYKNARGKDGRRPDCKKCQNETTYAWRCTEKGARSTRLSKKMHYQKNKHLWEERYHSMSAEERERKRLYLKEYYKRNKEKLLAQQRDRYKFIPKEQKKKYNQNYYAKNKEKVCEKAREAYQHMDESQKKRKVEITREWRRRNKEKMRAWNAVQRALKKGLLHKPEACTKCGKKDCVIQGHHADYSKPMEVLWVCHECHKDMHRGKQFIEK